MRKRSAIFFLILVLTSSVILLVAAQYGEDSTSLGQFVDEFTDLNNVSVTVAVVRNTTLNTMELNYTSIGFEDFTTFTEADPQNHLEQNTTTFEWNQQKRNENSYIWKDYTVGYFDDFNHQFEHEFTDVEAGDATANFQEIIWGVSSTYGTFLNVWGGTTLMIYAQQNAGVDDNVEYRLSARKGGGSIRDSQPNTPIQKYYIIFNRTGNKIHAYFYDDAEHTSLDFSLSITAWSDNLRYAIGSTTRYSAVDPNDHSTGYVKNMNFGGEGFAPTGYFSTVDYLNNVNGSTLALMTSTQIVPNTHITVQFSNDNATWGDAEGIPGDSHDLLGGLETIDLRPWNESTAHYVLFNLSSTDPVMTPRVNQSRLITTEGQVGAGPPPVTGDVDIGPWIAIAIILSIIAYLLARSP